jgi:hypothetical protein
MVVTGEPPYGAAVSDSQDENEGVSEDSAPASERPAASAAPRKKRARRPGARVEPKAPSSTSLFGVLIALAAAGIGAAGGWFGHDAQAKAKLRADSAPAAASAAASGPCATWQQKICAGKDESAPCMEAKAAAELLTPSVCEAALAALPATLAKLKAARVPCDTLVSKLCADLPPGSQTCAMVRERTPNFPTERCTEMLAHYDEVRKSLQDMDQQAGTQPNAPGLAHPQGMPAPGTQGAP